MRNGVVFSGSMHGIALLAIILGADWLRADDETPFRITEISLIDGEIFDASATALSTPETPVDPPEESAPEDPAPEKPEPDKSEEPEPEQPEISAPPPPVDIPTEPPRPSIAKLPSPDVLPDQAERPESPPSAEPVLQPPLPSRSPPPLEKPEAANELKSEREFAEKEPPEEFEEAAEVEPEPEAPPNAAPRENLIPVAKPADKAKAALAARKTEPVKAEKKLADENADEEGINKTTFAQSIMPGRKEALQLGIKKHFVYNGSRDRDLWVKIAVELDPKGQIIGEPKHLESGGGNAQSRKALFQSARNALFKARNAGEFTKLPVGKYDAWKLIHVRFFASEEVRFDSS